MPHTYRKNIRLIAACLLFLLALAHGKIYAETVTIRPSAPIASWSCALQPMESSDFFVNVINQESGYRLKSGPTVEPTTGAWVLWTQVGATEFTVVNTSPSAASTRAKVTCVWEPIPGGDGPGTRPPDIEGWATGTAYLRAGHIAWTISPGIQPAGTGQPPNVYDVRLVNELGYIINIFPPANFSLSPYNVNPPAAWTLSPANGSGPTLTGNAVAGGGSRGNLKLNYTYFGVPKTAISPPLTFVAIEKMQYRFQESWSDLPKPIYTCAGSNVQFRVLSRPTSTEWPKNKPYWTGATADGADVSQATATFPQPGTNYVTAECGNTVTATVVALKVDIEQTTEYFCWQATNATLNLTASSFSGDGNANWQSAPAGISGSGTNITFDPSALAPTTYVVTAYASLQTNCFDTCTVTVVKVELEASKSLLTLKHDRDCNLEVKTTPATGITVDEYRLNIKRTNSATWYVLSTNKTITPWHANIAGGFHLRGVAKIGGTEYYSTNIVVVNQFPTYSQIEGDSGVRSATDTEWANTLTDCTQTPNQRRERGFWILLNTTSNVYGHGAVVTGDWSGPTNVASIILPPRPADIPASPLPNADGATYSVASFHTHTPATYLTNYPPGTTRDVGPSPADNSADTADDVPGVVYDYTESPAGSGSIPMGCPKVSPAQRYLSLGINRRTTP